jgi:hypothetical protein
VLSSHAEAFKAIAANADAMKALSVNSQAFFGSASSQLNARVQ